MQPTPQNPPAASANQAGSGQDNSAFAPPQITPPKGGGAIRGIGEKFAANAVSGTGTLTVPIATSPGRSGYGPQLALAYDSGVGNGAFGLGWHLRLPTITWKTDKGLPVYHDSEHEESAVFLLSGQEDLVPVLRREAGGEWRCDQFTRDGYRIRRYRPRVEGLFARIERWTRLSDGDVHWRSLSKDNVLTLYGSTAESRIFDPANPARIFSWLICQSYDDRGNAIAYRYAAEDDRGVDLSLANERHRVRTANRYLKRVLYGNRRPFPWHMDHSGLLDLPAVQHELDAASWMFELVLDYGEGHYREDAPDEHGHVLVHPTPCPQTAWPVRKDPFSTYRSCFEVRTYRLCRRALMFHHFPAELGVDDYLVRSTEFDYDQKPLGSFIKAVVQSGYRREGERGYLKASLPPLELAYTASPLDQPELEAFPVAEVQPQSLAGLPGAVDGSRYRWADLNGEGIAGVLTEQGDAWFYKPNLGHGLLGAAELVARRPSLAALNGGRQQLLDVGGTGRLNLVELDRSVGGFYPRAAMGEWEGFRAFHSLPVRDWRDPNLRFVDITGDGIADILVTEDVAFTWHPSLLAEGFGPGVRIPAPHNEEEGPRVVFADGAQSIYLADMSGDGLSDIVRIRNGEVCYWPNLGYGRFGPKVAMDNAPWFDEPDLFDRRRIHLADTDGSGTTDILYLARDGVRIYLNQAGNGWSDARVVKPFPALDDLTAVSVTDLLGRGTACLVWSSNLPGDSARALRYVDLMRGQKPHLLVKVINNLGAETAIEYASSTEFYLEDKAAGRPWVTRLPFPVQVVKRVETYDYVSRNRFVTSYTYHHGYYDGLEREFRGFGRVEQLDTEAFGSFTASGRFTAASNEAATSNVPPVLTKTWFHTGVFVGGGRVSRHLAHEYYHEPRGEGGRGHGEGDLADTILPDGLTAEEAREACRALNGSTLRQEVYALDGTEESLRPYSVSESNFTIRPLQPRGGNLHAVFFTHPREALALNYERKLRSTAEGLMADPRAAHHAVLEVDAFGNVIKAVAVGYARRPRFAGEPEERTALLTLVESRYTNKPDEPDWYRVGVPIEVRTFEITRPRREDDSKIYPFAELAALAATTHEIPYETKPDFRRVEKRLIERVYTLYRRDDLAGPLPLGEIESRALPLQRYKLALTAGLAERMFVHSGKLSATAFTRIAQDEGRYVHSEGDDHWWIPSGKVFYAPDPGRPELEVAREHFFLPRRFEDPFGNKTLTRFDEFDLLLEETEDALQNIVRAEHDYRVLSPRQITDPNGNRSRAAFDTLGMVTGAAVMGKVEEPGGEPQGDTLEGFRPDLTPAELKAFLAEPHGPAVALLAGATARIIYDLDRFRRTRAAHPYDPSQWQPVFAATIGRETHVSDLLPGQTTKVQITFSYSDGFEREIQKKLQANPGPLVQGGPVADPRWVASGWIIFNNKGKPVRKFEPFFDDTYAFKFGLRAGVSPFLFYDPVGRVVATLHPDQTWEKVVIDPWRPQTWDVNDTVTIVDPRSDADAGPFFARIPDADYAPTWYEQRKDGAKGRWEQNAAQKATASANTPAQACLDPLGRTFLTVADNGAAGNYALRVQLDIEGNQLSVTDALGRPIMAYDYDVAGRTLHQNSVDAGERWMLDNVAGAPLLAWDSRGHVIRPSYDSLLRPTHLFVHLGDGPEHLVERFVYGEGQPDDVWRNLRTRVFQQFDGAGTLTNDHFDFKGNLLRSTRQLLHDYQEEVDWSRLPEQQPETFSRRTAYDALNRPTAQTMPDGSVIQAAYNEADLLRQVRVSPRGSATPLTFVANIDYNARAQPDRIDYGNGAKTVQSYDPQTFRLTSLETTRRRDGAVLQDLRYHYDPCGNITHIADAAQQRLYFNNHVVTPDNDYTYDAIYRLIRAEGREHIGEGSDPRSQEEWNDFPRVDLPSPSDGRAMRIYAEEYQYDAVGNFLRMTHHAAGGNWVRRYAYSTHGYPPPCNRLERTSLPGDPHDGPGSAKYSYDANGNLVRMPHLPVLEWDFRDQLRVTRQQVVDHGAGEKTYYVYDAAGQRVRAVTETPNGTKKSERIYLGGYEVFRAFASGGSTTLERQTLHVMAEERRVALVETKTIDTEAPYALPVTATRYQFDNHLGSACLELDERAAIISYEEYYPYGNTSYQAGRSAAEVSLKRYRYLGRERDKETGFYYLGARYYAPWLGVWTKPDPMELADGPNLYRFARSNPIRLKDPGGLLSAEAQREYEANRHSSERLTPDEIADVYKDVEDVPKHLEEPKQVSPQTTLQQQRRLAHGEASRAQSKAQAAARKPIPIKVKREQDFAVAKAGMRNELIDTVTLIAMGPLAFDPIARAAVMKHLADPLKAAPPAPTGDALRDYELRENYDAGKMFTTTVVAALSFVPVGEIAQGARLAAGKLPVPAGGLGSLGGQEWATFSERWAAAANETEAFTSEASQLESLASKMRDATAEEQQVIDKASEAFASKGPQGAGSAYHELEGAAPRGVDKSLFKGAYQLELKSHWTGRMTMDQIRSASAQSLKYSLDYQRLEGLVPIRAVRHVFANPSGGPAKILLWH